MTNWLPIDQDPKDGTPVLLKGGRYSEYDFDSPCTPVVCGFWDEGKYSRFDEELQEWTDEGAWMFAYWDDAWRSIYENPTHFMLIPE